jgi:hypothetical protein
LQHENSVFHIPLSSVAGAFLISSAPRRSSH